MRENLRDTRREVHYHSKRHMTLSETGTEPKRRSSTQKPRNLLKKPSGHLIPLEEDDIDNEVSVAIGPPPIRPKYDKTKWKPSTRQPTNRTNYYTASQLVKDILSELTKEFLTRQTLEVAEEK